LASAIAPRPVGRSSFAPLPKRQVFEHVLLALSWRLWQGGRGAQIAGIAVGVAVIAAGLWQTDSPVSMAVFVALGLALVLLLTIPASARAYFGSKHHVGPSVTG
jgi:hypothetical protein